MPRGRLLPGLGRRLGRHPDLAGAVPVGLRRVPGQRLRPLLYANVSRPLVERMDARLVVPVSGGSRMTADITDMLGRVLTASGIREPHPRRLSRNSSCPWTRAWTSAPGSSAVRDSFYALEPSKPVYAQFQENMALNGAAYVRAIRIAAGASDGQALIVEPRTGNTGEASIRQSQAHEPGCRPRTRVLP